MLTVINHKASNVKNLLFNCYKNVKIIFNKISIYSSLIVSA